MKTIIVTFFLLISVLAKSQSGDLIYLPQQKSVLASYTLNFSHVGLYVGGYIRSTFPAPYIYTTPMSLINRVGLSFGNGKYGVMAGGFVENFRDSIKVQPDIWVKVYPLRIFTNTKEGFDFILCVNYMKKLNYGVGISIPFGGIYCR